MWADSSGLKSSQRTMPRQQAGGVLEEAGGGRTGGQGQVRFIVYFVILISFLYTQSKPVFCLFF